MARGLQANLKGQKGRYVNCLNIAIRGIINIYFSPMFGEGRPRINSSGGMGSVCGVRSALNRFPQTTSNSSRTSIHRHHDKEWANGTSIIAGPPRMAGGLTHTGTGRADKVATRWKQNRKVGR